VLAAESGDEAIEILSEEADGPIDAVLMDVMMPTKDGNQTIREIRTMPRFARLPIIAVTARAMSGDREQCLEAGANDYISKPIDAGRLLQLLSAVLAR
jgi:CheY-like chemotaxis protein